jgi:hypothetical protein
MAPTSLGPAEQPPFEKDMEKRTIGTIGLSGNGIQVTNATPNARALTGSRSTVGRERNWVRRWLRNQHEFIPAGGGEMQTKTHGYFISHFCVAGFS